MYIAGQKVKTRARQRSGARKPPPAVGEHFSIACTVLIVPYRKRKSNGKARKYPNCLQGVTSARFSAKLFSSIAFIAFFVDRTSTKNMSKKHTIMTMTFVSMSVTPKKSNSPAKNDYLFLTKNSEKTRYSSSRNRQKMTQNTPKNGKNPRNP